MTFEMADGINFAETKLYVAASLLYRTSNIIMGTLPSDTTLVF